MVAGVKNNIWKGLFSNIFGQVVSVFTQLALVPVLVRCWGVERFGAWIVLYSGVQYFSLLDAGLASSLGNQLTSLVASGDSAGAARLYASASGLLARVILLVSSLVVLIAVALPSAHSNSAAFGLLAMGVLATVFGGVYQAALRCCGKYHLGVGFANMTRLAEAMALCSVAWLGGGELLAAATLLLVKLAGVFLLAKSAASHSHLGANFWKYKLSEIKSLFWPAVASVMMPFGYLLAIQGSVLVVAWRMGPVAVVGFSALRTLCRIVSQVAGVLAQSAAPTMAELIGLRDAVCFRRLRMRVDLLTLIFGGGVALAIFILGGYFFSLWVGGGVPFDRTLCAILLGGAVVNALWGADSIGLVAANRHIYVAVAFLVIMIVGLFFISALGGGVTLVSVALVLLVCEILMLPVVFRQSAKLFIKI